MLSEISKLAHRDYNLTKLEEKLARGMAEIETRRSQGQDVRQLEDDWLCQKQWFDKSYNKYYNQLNKLNQEVQ